MTTRINQPMFLVIVIVMAFLLFALSIGIADASAMVGKMRHELG